MQHALIDRRRARGVMTVRAEGAQDLVNKINAAFEAFKETNDARLKGIEKRFDDVVVADKVERINADIGEMQGALNQLNATLAALQVGGVGDGQVSAEQRDYAKAFDRFFRKGVDNGLSELAVKAAVRTDSDPDGGYVAPDQMETTIDRVLSTVSAMRGLARVIQISGGTYKKPFNQGGTTSGWVGQREARPETNTSTLALLEFPAMELYAMPAATQSMLDDAAINVEQWLADEVGTVFAEQEGAAYISGDGVNKPRGLLSYDTVANASYAWGKLGYVASGVAALLSDASNNGVDKLIDLSHGALKQSYRTNANWLMNRSTAATVRKLKDSYGQYLWQPSTQAGMPPTLLGYPLVDDDNMSDIGANAFPIAFGDFQRGYLIVDRVGVRVLRDPFTAKPYVLFYTTKRVGGGVQNFEAIKLMKIATS